MDATNFYAFALTFAAEHWFLAWCSLWMLWVPLLLPVWILNVTRSVITRICSMIMVALRGWPPTHLDADGDWKPSPKVVEEKTETVTCGDQSHTTTNKRRGERGLDPLRGYQEHTSGIRGERTGPPA